MRKIAGLVVLLGGLSSLAFAGNNGETGGAPEVNAGYLGGAFVLVSGAGLIIRSRLRK